MQLRLPENITHDLSVVIVSYNTRDMTIACVKSVLDHKGALDVEVIVVDNCSSDDSADALRKTFPQIKVIDSPANGGFAYGNNIAFEQCHGRFVLLLNPDTEVHPGGLEKAMAYMQANPKTGILGPRVLLDDSTQQSSMIRYLSLTQLFFIIFMPSLWLRKTSLFGDLRYANLSRDAINKVDAVSGCFMLAPRGVLQSIGGLNTRFFMYGEEAEWAHRTKRAGWDIVYNPEIEILHHGAASTSHMGVWKAIEMTRGHILFLRFTRGVAVAWLGTLLMTIRDLVRVPYYAVQTVLRGFRPSAAVGPWWARLKFLLGALARLPKGQDIALPDPEKFRT